jgi:hypothetical protein
MEGDKIYGDASEVEAEDGVVAVDGPDAVDVRFTPEAAEETSHRLLAGAMMAKGQEAAQRQGKKRLTTDG